MRLRLVGLTLEHFGGVAAARVEFGPGLNVLYGPNELGKSTIAQAIRAALLLPHTSSAHEPWVAWGTDHAPSVELVISTEHERFWRVKKTFGQGSRATAVFDESKDGITFTNLAKGRRVDGEIRKLLNWGIPEPGGTGGPKGLPETFLTAALLSPQDDTTRVFQKNLADDYDESGKKLMTDALQALAADPKFTQVVADTQARVDEAFTASGNLRRDQHSPFRQISEEIRRDEQSVKDLQEQVRKGDEVQGRLAQLRVDRLAGSEKLDRAREMLTQRKKAWAARGEIDKQLGQARSELERVLALHHAVSETETQETDAQRAVAQLTEQAAQAADTFKQAEENVARAREQLERARSADQAAARQIEQQKLEIRLHELDAAEHTAQQMATRATTAKEQASAIAGLEADLVARQANIAQTKSTLDEQAQAEQAARGELDLLTGLELWLKCTETRQKLQQAEQARATAESLCQQAVDKQAEAEQIQKEMKSLQLPTAEQLAELQKILQDLRVAEARLDVGLAITVRPLKSFSGSVARDNEKPKKQQFKSKEVTIEAHRRIDLVLGDWTELSVSGGAPEAQKQTANLQKRWGKEAQPALKAAGVTTLAELEAACKTAADHRQKVQDLLRDAAAISARVSDLAEPDTQLAELHRTAQEQEQALTIFDLAAIRKLEAAKKPDVKELNRRRKELDDLLDRARKKQEELRVQLARDDTQRMTIEQRLAALRAEHAQAVAGLSDGWQAPLARANSQLTGIATERESTRKRLIALAAESDTKLTGAEQELQTVEQRRDQAKAQSEIITGQLSGAAQTLAGCRAVLAERRKAASAVDLERARNAVRDLEQQRDTLPIPGGPISEQALQAEERRVEQAAQEVRRIETLIANEEGALKHIGGDVARERHECLADALAKKRERERDLELDYGAWKLLLETLREVENSEAAHLGQALVPAITTRFAELTGSRFGNLALGPNLEASGITAEGEVRQIELLSVGTREQLSAIYRLTLAEQLGSVLLLDDQLTQTDPQRMQHIRAILRACSQRTQIVVLTCRPEDYLLTDELPDADQSSKDTGIQPVRAINLASLIEHKRAVSTP